MKIIHCADVHLDSPMSMLGDPAKKRERKNELLMSFKNMVAYAANEDVSAIILAGDLFDQSKVSVTAKDAVVKTIEDNPNIGFYYLKGNHDKSDILSCLGTMPSNLHMFDDNWTTYDLGENICITGVELSPENSGLIYSGLSLDINKFNIVTLHGQESIASGKDGACIVSIKDLKNKNIDYLALGHVHSYKDEELDKRGRYCYPGCLEARGFDEAGAHGFVLLDINGEARSYKAELISKPRRTAHVQEVDITGLAKSTEIIDKIKEDLDKEKYPSDDLVEVTLTGEIDVACEKNLEYISQEFKDSYFFFKLKDRSGYKVSYDDYKYDESLKGEFIRTVQAADISEEDKAEIIRIGISALQGEVE